MKKITVLNNQSLFDISAQEYGTIEGIFEIALANGLGVTDTLTAGQKLVITEIDQSLVQPEIVDYYRRNNIHPATGETNVVQTPIPAPPATGDGCKWTDLNN